jgi:FkbM family methyltransferase
MLGEIRRRLQSIIHDSGQDAADPAPKPDCPDQYACTSYSQCGEDLIIDFVARQCGIEIKSYFDIGANHPFHYSNTYLSYSRGASGVCVEPIPALAEEFSRARPRDTVSSSVISVTTEPLTFYVLDPSTLSTFDPEALDRALLTPGASIVDTIQVSPVSLDNMFEEYGVPQLLCIDVEGGDLEVLASWDMSRFRPPLLCVEDLEYSTVRTTRRPLGVTDYLCKQGYMLFSNTFINSVLVDASVWVDP